MKRLLLFLGILASGFALLAVTLGTDDLLRDYERPDIGTKALTAPDKAMVAEGRGQRLEIGLPPFFEGPVTRDVEVEQPDGTLKQVSTSWCSLPDIQPYEGESGLTSTDPVLELRDRHTEEVVSRVTAQRTIIRLPEGTRFKEFMESDREVESIEMVDDVLAVLQSSDGAPFRLETDRVFLPGTVLHSERPTGVIDCPGPVRFRREDGSLIIEGSAAQLDLAAQTLRLEAPVGILANGLSFDPSSSDQPTEESPPLVATTQGPVTYRWRERAASDSEDSLPQLMGAGTITFPEEVRIEQGDRWLSGTRLVMELDQAPRLADPKGREELRVRSLELGDGVAPVAFGLLGGTGDARRLSWDATAELLSFAGPVTLTDIQGEALADGEDAWRIERLSARDRVELLVQNLDRSAADVSRKMRLDLHGQAELASPGQFAGRGQRISLHFLEPPNSEAAGTGFQLEGVDVLERASVAFDTTGETPVHADGFAEAIRLEERDGRREMTMTGQARLQLSGPDNPRFRDAEVRGPEIRVVAEDPEFTLIVEDLIGGHLTVPGDSMPGAAGTTADFVPVHFEPLEPTRFVATNETFDFRGRCRYRMEEGEQSRQLVCRSLTLEDQNGAVGLLAEQEVEMEDSARGAKLACTSLQWGEVAVATGSPARLTFPLEEGLAVIEGARLNLDASFETLVSDGGQGLARLEGPESLLRDAFPENELPEGADPASSKVVLESRRIALRASNEELPDGSSRPRLTQLNADGQVQVERGSDGSQLLGESLSVETASRSARMSGGEGSPASMRRPAPQAPGEWESLIAEWVSFANGGELADLPPGTALVFYVASRDDDAIPRRVEIRVGGRTELRGTTLQCLGGVETLVSIPDGDSLGARSERVEVRLDKPLHERGRPTQIFAQQRVLLEHPQFECTGSLLAFDFLTEWLELKAGLDPCRVISSSGNLPFPVQSQFQRLKGRLPRQRDGGLPVDEFVVEELELMAFR